MKRYAAHFLWSQQTGLQKQFVVEVSDDYAIHIFPLTEEIESAEWHPGIIFLLPNKEISMDELRRTMQLPITDCKQQPLYAHLFYPFDFILMQPVAGTQHRLLL